MLIVFLLSSSDIILEHTEIQSILRHTNNDMGLKPKQFHIWQYFEVFLICLQDAVS